MMEDLDKASADSFVKENIPRLTKQLQSGDNAMSFLAVYSFIEGYFRTLFPEYDLEKSKEFIKFKDIIKNIEENFELPRDERELYDELTLYYSAYGKKKGKTATKTSANSIRHAFKNIRSGSLSVVVGQFIEFSEYRGFITDEISNMRRIEAVERSRKERSLLPSNDSILYSQKNDLLVQYSDISKYYEEKTSYISELKRIDAKMMDSKYENPECAMDLVQLIRKKRELARAIDDIDSKLEELSEYTDFIQELAISLIEARSKENYEAKIIKLSPAQKDMINKDIPALTKRNGHSMLIKGGPGTGKTLVLIVMLLKLCSEGYKACLLTYYPTLNKYISYLSELYNDEKLLKEFNIPKISEDMFKNLETKGVLKFDDFIIPKIRKVLNIQKTYSLNDNVEKIREICSSVESDSLNAEILYEDITEKILPKILDESTYCTSSKKKEQWPKILKVFEMLDNNNEMLDLYAYYKFCQNNINTISLFEEETFDYILIDEAQDLTSAQVFAINKFVNKRGGLILAADPSQEIRNKRKIMANLDVDITGGQRYSRELVVNYRSSQAIQELGKKYRYEECLNMRKDTKSDYCITAGPPPQIFITDDTKETNYEATYVQIVNSVKMCTDDLCIVPENIYIVAFNEPELLEIQKRLDKELKIKSVRIYRNFSFKSNDGNVRLCTLKEIKGIDCPVLMFMITDQSKLTNSGDIKIKIKANAIYTCITRAMYLLQVFIPGYCRMSDLSVAVLVNKLLPNDSEVNEYVRQQRGTQGKRKNEIPVGKIKVEDSNEQDYLRTIEESFENILEESKYAENYYIQIAENLRFLAAFARKKIVKNVSDEVTEVFINDALLIHPECKIGEVINVPINLDELDDVQDEQSMDFVKILSELYEKYPEQRTDQNGNPLPNSESGYLSIKGFELPKPDIFGYKEWSELIQENENKFNFISYNINDTQIFAFKPKVKYIKLSELFSLASIFRGLSIPYSERKGTDYRIIKPQDIIENHEVRNGTNIRQYCDEKYMKSFPDYQKFFLKDGDILVRATGTPVFGIYLETGEKVVANNNIIVIRPNADSKEVLYNFFRSESSESYFCGENIKKLCERLHIDRDFATGPKLKALIKKLTDYNKRNQEVNPIENIEQGIVVDEENAIKPSEMDIIESNAQKTYVFTGCDLKIDKKNNIRSLRGFLKTAVDNISRGSVTRTRLEAFGLFVDESLIGKKFYVKLLEKNKEGNGWNLDIVDIISEDADECENVYTNVILGPDTNNPDCIRVRFEDSKRSSLHSLKIWRLKNKENLFLRCTRGTKIRYKVIESYTGYLQAIVLEILD